MVVAFLNELKNYLNFKEAICDVNLEVRKPLTESDCQEWENTNKLVLPSDLKDFYQTTNGFNFSWNNVCGEGKAIIGQIAINSLNQLTETKHICDCGHGDLGEHECPGPADQDLEPFLRELKQHSGSIRRMFLLERCLSSGYVVLGYQDNGTGIFFIDRDGCVYQICQTFTQYIRLAVAHLGLVDWHVLYTPTIPSNQSLVFEISLTYVLNKQQYMGLFVPERIPLSSSGMRLGNERDFGACAFTTINTKKLVCLEDQVNGRCSQSNRNAPNASVSKRGRSTESVTHKSGDANGFVPRKNR